MARLLGFGKRPKERSNAERLSTDLSNAIDGFSIEVMPRTAAKIEDLRGLFPQGTSVYVAHIDGTPIDDMVATVQRLTEAGYPAMPHIPARILHDKSELGDWLSRYRDAGARQALLLAGGVDHARGDFDNSMQLLETDLFDKYGFTRLHVAGHPEGNKDIDPDGSDRNALEALRWKQAFDDRTDADMAIVTQFAFEFAPVLAWAERLTAEGIKLPIHFGIAGPAKLQTMIKFAIACGVGPSLRVLQRRAKDVANLLRPYEPNEILIEFAAHKDAVPESNLHQIHFFPLGGIRQTVEFVQANGKTASTLTPIHS